jgi:predicted NBD/HSP70 family sugar kinase
MAISSPPASSVTTSLARTGSPGRRTIEEHCSRTGIRAIVSDSLRAYPDSIIHRLTGGDVNRLGTTEIKTAFEAGDELMVRTIDHVAHLLGTAIASIVTLLAVRTVLLGGGITEELGDPLVSKIRRSFELDVYPARCKECRIMPTKLAGGRRAARGGAAGSPGR